MHRIRIEHESDVLVLSAEGELDAYSAPALGESLDGVGANESDRFVVDLSKVAFMDSTALGLIVRALRRHSERGGRALVVLPDTMARRIFEITTLDRVLPVAPSRGEALRRLRALEDVPGGMQREG